MALFIKSEDRLVNKTPPRDPTDKSELNADNVMLIFDKIINGEYKAKAPWGVYIDINDFETNAEPGEWAEVSSGDSTQVVYKKQNGEIIILG